MALSIFNYDSTALSAGPNVIQSLTSPPSGVFVAALNFENLDACVLRCYWQATFIDTSTPTFGWQEVTVNVADPELASLMMSPFPMAPAADLIVDRVSGSPTGNLLWQLYQL